MQFRWPFNPLTGAPGDGSVPWTNGDPALGVEGAIPPAEALNDPQAEIVHAIDFFLGDGSPGSGQSAADLQQLRKAIQRAMRREVRPATFFDDTNFVLPFSTEASIVTAPVAFVVNYASAIPDRPSRVRGVWTSNCRITNPGETHAQITMGLTNSAGALLSTNEVTVEGPMSPLGLSGVAASSFQFDLAAGAPAFPIQLRCRFTTNTPGTGATLTVDDLGIYLMETPSD